MAKSGRLELGDNIYWQYRSIFNHCDIFGQQRNRNRRKKPKIRSITPFKVIHVIEVGTNRKHVCDFLLVINSNWHPSHTVSEISQLIVQILDTLRFWATLWGLRDNVRCSSLAHWKSRSELPISDNWTFFARCYGWGATSENTLWTIKKVAVHL